MSTVEYVALKRLSVSPLNVRQTDPAEAIDELADDIAAHGLLKNLVGHEGAKPGTIEIAAGGRRLQAMQLLVKRKAIGPNHAVPVLIVSRDEAREVSLSENIHRVALSPADEYEGFARIVADHAADPDPVALCARRQGVTRRRVEQSLRLAELAPEIFDALRAGTIGIEAAKAYAGVASHSLQLTVFRAEEARSWGHKHEPRNIRDALRMKTYDADCPQALYVGLDAYRAAGGELGRDMFMGAEERERLFHPSLLDKLARDKALRELPDHVKRDGLPGGLLTRGLGSLAAAAWPAAPAGMIIGSVGGDPADAPADAIGVYTLAGDGSGLVRLGWFAPVAEAGRRAPVAGSTGAAPAGTPVQSAPSVRDGSEDQIYRQAVRLVVEHHKGSTSWLQRQLHIGYNSAARLVEQMENAGVVSAPDRDGRREVLLEPADLPPPETGERRGPWIDPAYPGSRPGDELARQAALRLAAAHIAVERAAGGALEGHAIWPPAQGYVPAITPADDDPDVMIVAVLFRVSRAEIEAALPEAEEQIAEAHQANDLVAVSGGEPA